MERRVVILSAKAIRKHYINTNTEGGLFTAYWSSSSTSYKFSYLLSNCSRKILGVFGPYKHKGHCATPGNKVVYFGALSFPQSQIHLGPSPMIVPWVMPHPHTLSMYNTENIEVWSHSHNTHEVLFRKEWRSFVWLPCAAPPGRHIPRVG